MQQSDEWEQAVYEAQRDYLAELHGARTRVARGVWIIREFGPAAYLHWWKEQPWWWRLWQRIWWATTHESRRCQICRALTGGRNG